MASPRPTIHVIAIPSKLNSAKERRSSSAPSSKRALSRMQTVLSTLAQSLETLHSPAPRAQREAVAGATTVVKSTVMQCCSALGQFGAPWGRQPEAGLEVLQKRSSCKIIVLVSTGAAAVAAGTVWRHGAGAVSSAAAGGTAAVRVEEGVGLGDGDVHMLLHHAVDGDGRLRKRFQVFGAIVPAHTQMNKKPLSHPLQ